VRRPLSLGLAAAALALATPARAHHGVAAVGVAGPEGPGASMETTSPLPLPQGLLFAMAKSEYVPFQTFAFAEPENKRYSWFNMVAVGVGALPWLSAYVFQPFNVKEQDSIGHNAGPGDTNLMLVLAFKYDDGFRLVPEKESLDDFMDWHFSLWASCTFPVGPTTATDDHGAYFAPDMQTGFGAPAPALGVAALKQLGDDLTWLAEANYQYFFPHTYPFTRYQFGGETRLGTALTWRAVATGRFRLDAAGELNGLYLQRDQERNAASAMEAKPASGGAVLYATVGLRAYLGAFTAALGVKRAVLKDLNEQSEQQGSEGLEKLRAALTLGWTTRIF
jgi:hypothetical protein